MKTTDDQTELFTLVDENDRVLGSITRGEAHRDMTKIHRGAWVLVFNDKGEVFLQKRSLTKDRNPGLWSIAVGGHVTHGQTYREAAKREFMEELGIAAPALEFMKKYRFISQFESEIGCVYKSIHNGPFTLNPQEIDHGEFFTLEDLEVKIRSGEFEISNWALAILQDVLGIVPERPEKKMCIIKTFP